MDVASDWLKIINALVAGLDQEESGLGHVLDPDPAVALEVVLKAAQDPGPENLVLGPEHDHIQDLDQGRPNLGLLNLGQDPDQSPSQGQSRPKIKVNQGPPLQKEMTMPISQWM